MSLSLAVERSVSGRRWRARVCDEALALALCQQLELPEVVGRVLAARGIGIDGASSFLEPRVGVNLPDPSHLLDLEVAVARLADAVVAGATVGLLGDYDVDGATSVGLLARYLRAVGASVVTDVPDRLAEGYGPNPQALDRLAGQGARLVVTLDCGTTAHEALAYAAERGLEVIVVDHHVAEPVLPPAVAVVNPNRCDQTSPVQDLAAVGVTFLVAVGLNRVLRARGHFAGAPEPDLRRWLDLVALGTLCDVVPLTGLNRAFVAQGLRVAARGLNPGLAALARVARLEGVATAEHLGFWLGPRINAGGRVGRSDLGAALLLEDGAEEVLRIAQELDRLNGERRALERRVLEAADGEAAAQVARGEPLLLVGGEGWSPGVVGLAASRLVERYHRPAVVIGLAGETGKGSGRSVDGFDLGAAVIAARREGLLLQGGGHPMAAGLTVARDRLDALAAFLMARLRRTLGEQAPAAPDLALDGALQVGACSFQLAARLARLAPYGRANPEPRFMVAGARVWQVRRVGEAHIDCCLADPVGGRLRAIAFRAAGQPLGEALLAANGGSLHVAGRLKLDVFQGETRLGFHIEDAAPL